MIKSNEIMHCVHIYTTQDLFCPQLMADEVGVVCGGCWVLQLNSAYHAGDETGAHLGKMLQLAEVCQEIVGVVFI